MLEKENVVFAAFEKNQAVLAKIVVRSEIIAEQGAAGFGDDVVFHVHDDLRDLLPNAANNDAARGLQLRQARFDDVRLLAAFEMLAALANPFLAFEDQVGKLIAHFEGEEFEQAQAEEQVDFNIFVILGLRQELCRSSESSLRKAAPSGPRS